MTFAYVATRQLIHYGSILRADWSNFCAFFFVIENTTDDVINCVEMFQKIEKKDRFFTWSKESYECLSNKEIPPKNTTVHHFKFDSSGILCSGKETLFVLCDDNTVVQTGLKLLKEECIECALCHKNNTVADQTGPLSFYTSKDCQRWMHTFCFDFSRKIDEKETLQNFVCRTEKTTFGKYTSKCSVCDDAGATLGCQHPKCSKNYHLICAIGAGAERIEETGEIYCPKHILEKEKQRLSDCGFPDTSIFIAVNDWSKIDYSIISRFSQKSCHLEAFRPGWLQRKFQLPIKIQKITDKNHWAYCAKMAAANKDQYEVVASDDIVVAQIIGEYVGQVLIDVPNSQSNYATCLNFQHHLPLIIESEAMGNEMRFVNSVNDDTRKTHPHIKVNAQMLTVWTRGRPRVNVVALTNIKKGHPVVFDYGETYWDS